MDDREASNGCVRVEEIASLAEMVLRRDGQSAEALDAALESGETHSLALSHPVPVYMLYWTAVAGPDGTVGFRPDYYYRDMVLLAKMTGTGKPTSARPKAKALDRNHA